jgi:hypothetical protein
LEDLSSVDFFACCGIGHRLVRMSLAHFVAKQRNFTLRGFWGWCGEKSPVEVFSYLFRPYTADEVSHVTNRNTVIPFYNEVPGFDMLVRTNHNSPKHNSHSHSHNNRTTACACQQDKIDSDLEFYTSLRTRFRKAPLLVVDDFVQRHFRNATVLGIHVRAGNGETGDFIAKGRTIENPETWVRHVCSLLQDFLSHQINPTTLKLYPPVLYIATDTPSMISLFRKQLQLDNNQVHILPVLDLPQQRQEQGKGVFFGQALQVLNKGQEDHDADDESSACLKGWTDTLMDMLLLSHADVVIAGKPSSFSQTLPMSLAFGRQQHLLHGNKKVPQSYCEIIPQYKPISTTKTMMTTTNSTWTNNSSTTTESSWQEIPPKMKCFSEYLEWCCNHATWIKFKHKHKVVSREFIKFQKPNQAVGGAGKVGRILKEYPQLRNRTEGCLRPKRGRAGGGLKDKCLPHEW